MLKLDQNQMHIVTITDTRTGATMRYTTKNDPQTSARGAIKTIRNLQNKKTGPDWLLEKYAMFLNTPAEKLAVTITLHFNFEFSVPEADPVRRAQLVNEHYQRKAKYTLVNA